MNLIEHIFMWVGIYLTVGLLISLVNFGSIKDWITDPHKTEKEFNELCACALMFGLFWPLLLPMFGWLELSDKIYSRWCKKIDKEWEYKNNFISFLCEIEILSDEKTVELAKELHNDRVRLREAKRKKLKMP